MAGRRLDLLISDEEFARRRAEYVPPVRHYDRGYGRMFLDHILQANQGCDFDYLVRHAGGEELQGTERSKKRRATDHLPEPF